MAWCLVKHRVNFTFTFYLYLEEVECGGVDWIHLAQVRDQWRAVVNTVMNLWVL
jgi:hypothetical protein